MINGLDVIFATLFGLLHHATSNAGAYTSTPFMSRPRSGLDRSAVCISIHTEMVAVQFEHLSDFPCTSCPRLIHVRELVTCGFTFTHTSTNVQRKKTRTKFGDSTHQLCAFVYEPYALYFESKMFLYRVDMTIGRAHGSSFVQLRTGSPSPHTSPVC